MSNKYYRHQSVINREADSHIDEDHWLNQFQKSLEKSAVQSRRVDQSLFEQITGIMNNKSKYTSVSAAVEDMMQRSGLTGYLDNINKVSQEETSNTKKASDDKLKELKETLKNCISDKDWFKCGKVLGQIHKHQDQIVDALHALKKLDTEAPKYEWLNFAAGYAEGANLSDNKKEESFQKIQSELGVSKKAFDHKHDSLTKKDEKKVEDAAKVILPILFKKVPSILKTVENYIRDTRGNLPIPAIIEKIKSIHHHDVSDARDWEDIHLLRFISQKNLEQKANKPSDGNYSSLGLRDTSLDANDSNTDAFSALMPAKI